MMTSQGLSGTRPEFFFWELILANSFETDTSFAVIFTYRPSDRTNGSTTAILLHSLRSQAAEWSKMGDLSYLELSSVQIHRLLAAEEEEEENAINEEPGNDNTLLLGQWADLGTDNFPNYQETRRTYIPASTGHLHKWQSAQAHYMDWATRDFGRYFY